MPGERCYWRTRQTGLTGLLSDVPVDGQLEGGQGLADSLLLVSRPHEHPTAFSWHKTRLRL